MLKICKDLLGREKMPKNSLNLLLSHCIRWTSYNCAVISVAASVNHEVPDLSTQYAFTASGNVTSLIVTRPCSLISYIAGLQQVTEPTRYAARSTLC